MIALTHLSFAPRGALSPVLARLGLTLLHTIWEGTLVAALLWVSLTILRGRSPQVRYLAGCAAALAIMVGMMLTFLLVPASGMVSLSAAADRGRNGVAAAAASDTLSRAELSAGSDLDVSSVACPRPAVARRPFLTEGRKLLVTWCQRGATLLPSLALAWAGGVLALAGRLIAGCIGVRRLRSHGTSPVESCWQQRFLALARRMHIDQPVSLRQSTGVTTPAVVGWLRPVILLPLGMCAGLTTAQVEMILAHELAHVGRQDYLVNLLLNVVETVLFYHPAIWWIAAQVREERENACDDLALAACDDDRLGYARALASLEEMRLPLPLFALTARGDNGTLLVRVRRLLGTPGTGAHAFPSRNTACGLAGTVILCGAGVAFLIVAGSIPARSQEAASAASTPAASTAPANGTAWSNEISRLGVAAMQGDHAAIEQLDKIAATARGMNPEEKKALYLDLKSTFVHLGTEAGRGNAAALRAIHWASHRDALEYYAAGAFGQAAAMGNAEAFKPLLDPEDYGILPSSAVLALQPAVDAGNTRAIEALAAIAADPEGHSVWYMAATEVAGAAGTGNTTAIDSLAALAVHQGRDVRRVAIRALEVAAGKGHPSARQALDRLPPALRQEDAGAASTPSVSAAAGTPAAGSAPADGTARRDEISRLGMAAMRGDHAALEQLDQIAATANRMNADQKAALSADLRRTFTVLATEAGRGNAAALQAILRASHFDELRGLQFDELEGFAVGALGEAAQMGNAEALKPLLEPENHGILRSSAVGVLKSVADTGNTQAIEALAATAADPKQHALWFLAAEGLTSAAAAGDATAIDSLAALAADKNPSVHRAAIRALEVAADKGHPSAQQALQRLRGG